jgi:hypothetical protein
MTTANPSSGQGLMFTAGGGASMVVKSVTVGSITVKFDPPLSPSEDGNVHLPKWAIDTLYSPQREPIEWTPLRGNRFACGY